MREDTESEWWEYGYRVGDEEVWAYDHGDGEWTSGRPDLGVPYIDIRKGRSPHRTIYEALDAAGVEGVAITRRVQRFEAEEVERPLDEIPHDSHARFVKREDGGRISSPDDES